VHIKPGSAACHEKLGSAMVASNDLTDGVRELEQAVQLDPQDPKKHYELGRALRQAGQVDRAKQEFAASQKLYATGSSE
jgi:Flp pilus assembly protein TadD